MSELSRPIRLNEIGAGLKQDIVATDVECVALSRRFDLVTINHLSASLTITQDDAGVHIRGLLKGQAVAACVISAEDVRQNIQEDIDILAVPETAAVENDEEIELDTAELDIVHFANGKIDVGEIVADSFALALNPYPRAEETVLADARRHLQSEDEAEAARLALKQQGSPFSALKKGD